MLKRCFLFFIVLAAFAAPSAAVAGSPQAGKPKHAPVWRSFSSKAMSLSFRFPANWTLSASTLPGQQGQVGVMYQGHTTYSLTVQILPGNSGGSIATAMTRFMAYERSLGNTSWTRIAWSPTSLGSLPARSAVIRPQTEGGVSVSDALIVTQWRYRVYLVIMAANHRPTFSRLAQFPPIYRTILNSMHFL